uniref:Capsid protein n=1 Tax=Bat astrovirus 3 TaxID=3003851 RepID=A0AA49EBC8_9VIRU|nr:MAG: capsid protein [Bat astrovirus 3]
MAEAPKPQRRRVRRNAVAGVTSAAPTADTSPSGTSVTTVPRSRRRARRSARLRARRARRPVFQEIVEIRPASNRRRLNRAIKREIKREGLDGPKVSVQQKITSTFGLVRPNTTGNVELELNFFLHPSLAKEANEGSAFGPVQALAAQYSLWKLRYLTVRFTPMVGASAVSGTVVRASLNMSQSPGTSSWSGLGTRIHMDMHPGQTATFHLRADQLGGPRDGGWWFTDTNEEGSQSAGPIIEVHTMGLTKSTFRNEDWDGPLFLVEGIGMWQFANYNVKPALGSLERREGEALVTLKATAAQPITLEMPSGDSPALFMDSMEPESYATPTGQTVGETIFQIVDVGAKLAQNVAPPPFGWLIKGGWWFVKKLLKRGARVRANTSEYVVYASLQDAQANRPAIATGNITNGQQRTNLLVTQINSPNVGPNPTMAAVPRGGAQVLQPGDSFKLSSAMITEVFIKVPKTPSSITVPISGIPGNPRQVGTGTPVKITTAGDLAKVGFIQTPWWVGVPGKAPGEIGAVGDDTNYVPNDEKGGYIHSLYRLHDPRFTNQSGEYEYLAPEPSEDFADFSVLKWFQGDGTINATLKYEPYGKVVATSRIFSGTNPQLDMVFSLIRLTRDLNWAQTSDGKGVDRVNEIFLAYGDKSNQISFVTLPKTDDIAHQSNGWPIFERDTPNGTYLLGVSYTNAVGDAHGAYIPTFFKPQTYSRIETTWSPIFPYYLAGQMLPATSIDVMLEYNRYIPPNRDLVNQLKTLKVSFTLPPCLSEESGKPGPSADGEGDEVEIPCVLPPDYDEDDPQHDCSCDDGSDSDADSVEQFILELGNEMIDLPKRWLNDPEFSRFLDM